MFVVFLPCRLPVSGHHTPHLGHLVYAPGYSAEAGRPYCVPICLRSDGPVLAAIGGYALESALSSSSASNPAAPARRISVIKISAAGAVTVHAIDTEFP